MPRKKYKLSDIFAILGAFLAILSGALTIIGTSLSTLIHLSIPAFGGFASGLIAGLVLVIIGVIVLGSLGVISSSLRIEMNWIAYFVFAIVTFLLGSTLSALLFLLATILAFFKS